MKTTMQEGSKENDVLTEPGNQHLRLIQRALNHTPSRAANPGRLRREKP